MKNKTKSVIQSILTGENEKALSYLYKDPLRKVRKFVLNNSGTLDDADDVFQDAVVVLFDYVKTGKYKEEYDLDGFLFRVAKNAWVSLARKKQKVIKEELKGFDLSDNSNQLNDIIADEKLKTFYLLFDKLEEGCRKILSLAVFDKKSMKEIAVFMGFKNEKVAKNQLYRCRKYFSKILAENKEALKVLQD